MFLIIADTTGYNFFWGYVSFSPPNIFNAPMIIFFLENSEILFHLKMWTEIVGHFDAD